MTNAKTATKTWTCRKCGFCQALAATGKVCISAACTAPKSATKRPGDSRGRNRPTTWC